MNSNLQTSSPSETRTHLDIARNVFDIEATALAEVASRLDENFEKAIAAILRSSGRVVVCGMGKSGIIGKKIASTIASTGTPAFFMHPGEAYHGDLGMVGSNDLFLAISNSGETEEVVKLIPFLRDNGNVLIALTGKNNSTLAANADVHLNVGVSYEACPLQLAPTSSTTATLVMGDAIAIALMTAKGFRKEGFARFHPGGSLGRRLLRRVEDEMQGVPLPIVAWNATFPEIIHQISHGRLGLTLVCSKDLQGLGIITDGDIRRIIDQEGPFCFNKSAQDFATRSPITVEIGTRVEDAICIMESKNITSLIVLRQGTPVGVFRK